MSAGLRLSIIEVQIVIQALRRLRSKKNNDATKPSEYNADKAAATVKLIGELIDRLENLRAVE
jgi:hypothetical protein